MILETLLQPEKAALLWLTVGLLGSLLEAIGENRGWPKLVAFGQRLESASVDLPKLVRGSRATKMRAAKDDDPPTPRTGASAAPLTLLLLAGSLAGTMALAPVLSGCSPAATPEAQGAQAAQTARLAYNAAAVSVQVLADVHATWMEAVVRAGDPAAAAAVQPAAAKVTAALESATGALARARQYLEAGENEAKVRQQLREAVGFADLAVAALAAAGRPLPDKAVQALDFLRGLLGAAPTGGAS